MYSKKHKPLIYSTEEWAQCILESNKTKKFHVTVMDTVDFKDFTHFFSHIVKKTNSDDGKTLNFSDAAIFYLSSENSFLLQVAYNHCFEKPVYTECNIKKRGRKYSAVNPFQTPQKYNAYILINKKKLDIHSLLM